MDANCNRLRIRFSLGSDSRSDFKSRSWQIIVSIELACSVLWSCRISLVWSSLSHSSWTWPAVALFEEANSSRLSITLLLFSSAFENPARRVVDNVFSTSSIRCALTFATSIPFWWICCSNDLVGDWPALMTDKEAEQHRPREVLVYI